MTLPQACRSGTLEAKTKFWHSCLHDNAKPHYALKVEDHLKEEGISLMPHPPYSPELSPCDYWLNDYIKRNLVDKKSRSS